VQSAYHHCVDADGNIQYVDTARDGEASVELFINP